MNLCECGCGETVLARFVSGHNARLRVGSAHPQWKGDDAGYMAVHNWLRREKPKTGICEECGKMGRTDWANISGEYWRDLDDYRELCRGCHVAQDRERDPLTGQFL